MKIKVVEVGDGHKGYSVVALSTTLLSDLGWKDGDEVRLEPVVNRAGKTTHFVLEK